MERTQGKRVERVRPLITPHDMEARIPISEISMRTVERCRQEVSDILSGESDRMIGIVGPCSIHSKEEAIEYAGRLLKLRGDVEDQMLLIMRAYFEKPRTTVGWKGLINDPHMDGSSDLEHGLMLARDIARSITEMGIPIAIEALDPVNIYYISGLVSYAAIGARTAESQTHREMASGLSMPVGFKNGTDGSVATAINAIRSARAPHSFLGIDDSGRVAIIKTSGNDDGHIILRGGDQTTNFDDASIRAAQEQLRKVGLPPVVIVDCSHGNSGKQYENQPNVLASLVEQRRAGNRGIVGFMLESNLFPGRQDIPKNLTDLSWGVSVTDACIGWEMTNQIILDACLRLRSK